MLKILRAPRDQFCPSVLKIVNNNLTILVLRAVALAQSVEQSLFLYQLQNSVTIANIVHLGMAAFEDDEEFTVVNARMRDGGYLNE